MQDLSFLFINEIKDVTDKNSLKKNDLDKMIKDYEMKE